MSIAGEIMAPADYAVILPSSKKIINDTLLAELDGKNPIEIESGESPRKPIDILINNISPSVVDCNFLTARDLTGLIVMSQYYDVSVHYSDVAGVYAVGVARTALPHDVCAALYRRSYDDGPLLPSSWLSGKPTNDVIGALQNAPTRAEGAICAEWHARYK